VERRPSLVRTRMAPSRPSGPRSDQRHVLAWPSASCTLAWAFLSTSASETAAPPRPAPNSECRRGDRWSRNDRESECIWPVATLGLRGPPCKNVQGIPEHGSTNDHDQPRWLTGVLDPPWVSAINRDRRHLGRASGAEGHRFESCRARHIPPAVSITYTVVPERALGPLWSWG